MASREEFASLMRPDQQPPPVEGNGHGATQDWVKSWSKAQGGGSPRTSRPPQAPKPMEHTPLLAPVLPPMPQSTLPPSSKSKRRGHGRSHSELVLQPESSELGTPHPFHKSLPTNRSNRPPRAGVPPPPALTISYGSPQDGARGAPSRKSHAHRRAKSDIPLALYGGSVTGSRRDITKADLLKSLPAPRWGGAAPNKNALTHTRSRSRTGSDGLFDDNKSVASGSGISLSGYGAIAPESEGGHPLLTSIGSVAIDPDARRPTSMNHLRSKSDASAEGVTTNLTKSAMFKGVTDTGRIQLQLPKDSFRLLMDQSLEAGHVYKRKLVENEGEFFVEFHTVDDAGGDTEEKRLPPDLYVMAVDSSIYRRMLDEVISSRTMPCGTFFCGHHEDVRHPDITIAALIVGLIFFLLLAGSVLFS